MFKYNSKTNHMPVVQWTMILKVHDTGYLSDLNIKQNIVTDTKQHKLWSKNTPKEIISNENTKLKQTKSNVSTELRKNPNK